MKISRELSDIFMRAFLKARNKSPNTPYLTAYNTYKKVMGSDTDFTLEELATAMLVGTSFVATYFIASVETGTIKIGKTTDIAGRFSSLQSSSPVPLALAYFHQFDYGLEKRVHDHLSDYRNKGEWFDAAPEVIGFIRGMKNNSAEWLVDTLGEPCRNWADALEMNGAIRKIMVEDFLEKLCKARLRDACELHKETVK